MSKDTPIRITKDDFTVVKRGEDECECGGIATHAVRLDVRAIGAGTIITEGCESCCNEYLAEIQAGLPEATDEDYGI